MGNIHSVSKALESLEEEIILIKNNQQIKDCKALILPGVGAFDHAMDLFTKSGMREITEEMVIGKKKPVLGLHVILFGFSDYYFYLANSGRLNSGSFRC